MINHVVLKIVIIISSSSSIVSHHITAKHPQDHHECHHRHQNHRHQRELLETEKTVSRCSGGGSSGVEVALQVEAALISASCTASTPRTNEQKPMAQRRSARNKNNHWCVKSCVLLPSSRLVDVCLQELAVHGVLEGSLSLTPTSLFLCLLPCGAIGLNPESRIALN